MPEEPALSPETQEEDSIEYLEHFKVLSPFKNGYRGKAETLSQEFDIRHALHSGYMDNYIRNDMDPEDLSKERKHLDFFNAAAEIRNSNLLKTVPKRQLDRVTPHILKDQLFNYIPWKSTLRPVVDPEHTNPVFKMQLGDSPHSLIYDPHNYPGAADGKDGPLSGDRHSFFKDLDDYRDATWVWEHTYRDVNSMKAADLWKAFKTELEQELDIPTQAPNKGEFTTLVTLGVNSKGEHILISLAEGTEDYPDGVVNPNHEGAFELYTMGEDGTFEVRGGKPYGSKTHDPAHNRSVKQYWVDYAKRKSPEYGKFVENNFNYWTVMQMVKNDLSYARYSRLEQPQLDSLRDFGSLVSRFQFDNGIKMGSDYMPTEDNWSIQRQPYLAARQFTDNQRRLLDIRFPIKMHSKREDEKVPTETQLNRKMRMLGEGIERHLQNASTWGGKNILTGEHQKETFVSFLNFFKNYGIDHMDVDDETELKHAVDLFGQYLATKQYMANNGMKSAWAKYEDSYRPKVFKKEGNWYQFDFGQTGRDKQIHEFRSRLKENETMWIANNSQDPFGSLMNFSGFEPDETDLIASIYYYNRIPEADTDEDKKVSKEEYRAHMEDTAPEAAPAAGEKPLESRRKNLRMGEQVQPKAPATGGKLY